MLCSGPYLWTRNSKSSPNELSWLNEPFQVLVEEQNFVLGCSTPPQ